MKTLLTTLFINNWQRKFISILLAITIWISVNHSLTAQKTVYDVGVRVINIPKGKTIEGLQSNGLLSKKINLNLSGNKSFLDDLSGNDIEVVIDASNKKDEWIAKITKKNLVSLNPHVDISKHINRVSFKSFILRLTKLVTEKIPVIVTQPIGEAPSDYQFLNVWPHRLYINISGPAQVVKMIKSKGLRLIFNLNDISKAQLDAIHETSGNSYGDIVSFFVPDQWKQIYVPSISDTPLEINDPQAKALRIDFIRSNLLPLENPLPIYLFFPPHYATTYNPSNTILDANDLISKSNSLYYISKPLYVKGVSRFFLKVVKDMMQIAVIVNPSKNSDQLSWSLQFLNPNVLEDRYVWSLLSDDSDNEIRDMQPILREDYLRSRFRSYMNRLRLYDSSDKKLDLNITLDNKHVQIHEVQE